MRHKALLIFAALLNAFAFLYIKSSGLEHATTIHIPYPAGQRIEVRVLIAVLEEWTRSARVALPFAIAVGLIYKRSWFWVSVLICLPYFALEAFHSVWFECHHLTWILDCVQLTVREACMLTLLTWLVVKVAAHSRARNNTREQP